MLVTVTGKHLDIGDSLRSYVENNLNEVISKRSNRVTTVHVIITKQKQNFKTDVILHDGSGHHVVIKGHGEDPEAYISVDSAIDKVGRQLNKYQDKLKNHHKTPKEYKQIQGVRYVIEAGDDDQVIGDNPAIIAENVAHIPTLSVSDAVMKMDLSAANMLIFVNKTDNHLNVLSYRKDGNISWVDTKIPVAV